MKSRQHAVDVKTHTGIDRYRITRIRTADLRGQWNEFDLALLCGLLDIYEGTGQDTLGGGF